MISSKFQKGKRECYFSLLVARLSSLHADHTCHATVVQCILQYIALAQDVSVLTLGLQSLQAGCQ